MNKNLKIFLVIILAILAVLGISLSHDNTQEFHFMIPRDVIWVLLLGVYCFVINKVLEENDRRLHICIAILSGVLAFFQIIGSSINKYFNLSAIILSKTTLLKSMIIYIGYFITIYIVLFIIFKAIDKFQASRKANKDTIKDKGKNENKKEFKFFTANKKSLFIIWAIILICYIPYFLNYFPGNISSDSMNQIVSVLDGKLDNNHPIAHTFIVGICIKIGMLFNNLNAGIAIYSVLQMILVSGIFSYTIYYMAKKNIPVVFRVISLAYFALYHVHGIYSVTMWKDIPFAIVMLLYTICLCNMSLDKEAFFKSKRKIAYLIIISILACIMRNNGLYVVILMLPVLFFAARKYYKQLIVVSLIIISFMGIYQGPVFKIFNIEKGRAVEALSIPVQQFARIYRDRKGDLSEEEINSINNFFKTPEGGPDIGEIYFEAISDNVKRCFKSDYYEENKGEFISLWVNFIFKFPKETVEAFLCNSYGYFYPETFHWISFKKIVDFDLTEHEHDPLVNIEPLNSLAVKLEEREIPLVSSMYSIGLVTWIILACITYLIYKKRYNLIVVYIPLLFLLLTVMASPVFCEFRYVYSLFTCIPVLLSCTIMEQNDSIENKVGKASKEIKENKKDKKVNGKK